MSPRVNLDPEVFEALESRIDAEHPTVEAVIAALLGTSGGKLVGDPFFSFTQSKEFRACANDADRYIALLGKVHQLHRAEFGEFVAAQTLRRRYFGSSREEVCEASRFNQARQIPGSKYWAIMNIDTATKRRFLKRLLVFIGYPDEMVSHARGLIGGR